MKQTFLLFWCVAGLLTLHTVLRSAPGNAAPRTPPLDTLPVVAALRTSCELPAGTLVFVIRREEGR